jgi:hypothetical protein
LSQLVDLATEAATHSTLPIRHGAVLFSSKNRIYQTCCNDVGHRVCGYDVPSLHAEALCLKPIYNHWARTHRCREKDCRLLQRKVQHHRDSPFSRKSIS